MIRSLLLLVLSVPIVLPAQKSADSLQTRSLEEVVVTATRSERMLGALPLPVMLVPKTQIRAMGSLRLGDVLNEQTGLVSVPQVNGIGNGLQLQGFDPDYTLILIDGEPLVGRTTGSLDLNRITVGNIRQVEIVKGPSSSLYGSDALAGVVNVITDRPQGTEAKFYSRYGTNNTLDLSGDAGFSQKKMSGYVFGNRYSSDGYNLGNDPFSKTVAPFHSYTTNSKLRFNLLPRTELSVSGRYYDEFQSSRYVVDSIFSEGSGRIRDWNLNPMLIHRLSNKLKTTARFYNTRYETHSELHRQSDGEPISRDDFAQTFQRPEINSVYFINAGNILTGGAGWIRESVQTNRYGDENKRFQTTRYGFLQYEWNGSERVNLIAGARYDRNNIYGSQLSPKFSGRWVVSRTVAIKGSAGVGFKSPDFRQLYLNFTNAAAGGYSVFGTEVARQKLAVMDQQGLIAAYIFDPSLLGQLKDERSASFNLGSQLSWSPALQSSINFFRNNVEGLIETQVVAVTTANQSIYSYRNLNHVYTEGMEMNSSWMRGRFTFSLGYQLLYAKDQAQIAAIRNGQIFRRDPVTLESYRLKPSDYFGLYNRSRHMGNFKIFYEDKQRGYSASVRVIYRGRYGIGSTFGNTQGAAAFTSGNNGNNILDIYDKFVGGYALVNLSAARTWSRGLRLQAGIDNLFNHVNPTAIPNLPGRLLYTSVSLALRNPKTNNRQ